MSIVDEIASRLKAAQQDRKQRLDELGLRDPSWLRQVSVTWALLRNDLAPRCAKALCNGDLYTARRLARRWKAADDRSNAANERANVAERELLAHLRGLQ